MEGIEVFRILRPIAKYDAASGKSKIILTKKKMYEKIPNLFIDSKAPRSICTTIDEKLIFVATYSCQFLVLLNNELVSE